VTPPKGSDTVEPVAKSKVVSLDGARKKRRSKSDVGIRQEISRIAAERRELGKLTPEELETNRQTAMRLRERAGDLEIKTGLRSVTLGLHSFALLMHWIAEGKTTLDARGADWEGMSLKLQWPSSPDNLRKMWRVFEWLHLLPITDPDSPAWALLDSAYEVVTTTSGNTAKRQRVLHAVRTAVDWVHMRGQGWAVFRSALDEPVIKKLQEAVKGQGARTLIADLGEIDARFKKLTGAAVERLLLATRPTVEVAKGGAGNSAPALCAARLSRACGALDDDKVTEDQARKRYLAAEVSARR
jgi:hypothetical protein